MLRLLRLILLGAYWSCAWIIASSLSPHTALAEEGTRNRIVITTTPGAEGPDLAATFDGLGLDAVQVIEALHAYTLEPRQGVELEPAISALFQHPNVRTVERDGVQRLEVVPDDSLYRPFQWNLRRIGMEQAWNLKPVARDIVVAVLDSGADLQHPDLLPNLALANAYNFLSNSPDVQDDETHGTAVAGIIGAVGNNGQGVAGIAWRVRIMPLKVLNAQGRGTNSTLARAVVHAADHGARIINISSTSTEYSVVLDEAIEYARAKGALVVAAAGNTGDQANEVTYPAAFEGVVAVGAVDDLDQLASFSQRRPYVAIVAPGVDVPSTAWPGAGRGLHGIYTGTSIAAPHVSGLAALLWTMRPDLDADEIAKALVGNANPLSAADGETEGYGAGLVSANRAVRAVRLGVPPVDVLSAASVGVPAPDPVPAPAPLPLEPRRWYFAEGSTNSPFEVWFAIHNPNARPGTARFTFLSPEGAQTVHEMRIEAHARETLFVNDILPNAEFATIVQTDIPIYVERSMYFGHDGHSAGGIRLPSRSWYLAEGSTVPPFDTWILLMNPNAAPAVARLTFMHEDGTQVQREELIPAFGRRSVYANLLFQAPGFSTKVEADQAIVVERAMYFDARQGGHDTMAGSAPARRWYLAAGASRDGFDTWLLVQNPGTAPATVEVRFLTEEGQMLRQPMYVLPQARASLFTNLVVPDAAFGMVVDSDQPIIVERAVYFDGGRAGYGSMASSMVATEWYLPEGTTTGSFLKQLSILNPQTQEATVQMEFGRQDGQDLPPQRVRVPPQSRITVDVNAFVLDQNVATRVISDRPIVVERTLYFARPTGQGATSSVGLLR